MKFLTYISIFLIALFAASCTKVAPLNKIEQVKAEGSAPEKTAVTIIPGTDGDAGITDPENDEDHDKDAVRVY